MGSLQGILQKMGSNFIVAAFVPSMGFVLFSLIVFEPILPSAIINRIGGKLSNGEGITLIAALFTTLLGFTLFTLSTFIYKSFEGYSFLLGLETVLRKLGIKRQKKRANTVIRKQQRINRVIKTIERRNNLLKHEGIRSSAWQLKRRKRYEEKLEELKARKYFWQWYYNQNFPPAKHLILPTRFGNILRAAENYSAMRYGMDAVLLYPRMAHVIPRDSMDKLDQSNNQCLFLLNCALLSTIFSILSVLASAYQYLLSVLAGLGWKEVLYFIPINLPISYYQDRIGVYILVSILSALLAWFFYEAALLNVGQYGNMIRSVFDLYRFDLLTALRLALPENSGAEYYWWKQISEFMATGEGFKIGEKRFDYIHPSDNVE